MTDLAAGAPPPLDFLGPALQAGLRAAPELYQSPSVAVSAAQTPGDPAGNAEVAAQAGNAAAISTQVDTAGQRSGSPDLFHKTLGWLGGEFHNAKNALGASFTRSFDYMNKPLQEVQHDYRYLRDVEARHGPIAATLEGLAVLAGAGVGAYLGDSEGAILGGELTTSVAGRTVYHDSWARTANGQAYLDPSSGQPVSIGRDVAGLIGKVPGLESAKPGHGINVVAGVVDGIADLTLDPLAVVGRLHGAAQSAEGLGGAANALRPGLSMNTPEDLAQAVDHYGTVRRALADIASKPAEQIALDYPKLGPVAADLGRASTADEVQQVLSDALAQKQMNLGGLAPSLSRVGQIGQVAAEAARNSDNRIVRATTTLVPTAWDPQLLRFSSREFTPGSGTEYEGIYRTLRMGMSDDAAKNVLGDYVTAASSGDLGHARQIYKNGIEQMLLARGVADDHPFLQNLDNVLHLRAEAADAGGLDPALGRQSAYGADVNGRDISQVVTPQGQTISAALGADQLGKWSFPDYTAVKRAAQESSLIAKQTGAVDDFVFNHWTQTVFKPLALATYGFAQRIALSELIPNLLREGPYQVFRSAIQGRVAKAVADGLTMVPEEMPHLESAIFKLVQNHPGLVNQQDLGDLTDMVIANDGHIVSPGVDAQHGATTEVAGPAEKARRSLTSAYRQVPLAFQHGDAWGLFGRTEREAISGITPAMDWQNWLSRISSRGSSTAAAKAMADAYDTGASIEEASRSGAKAASDWLRAQPDSYLKQFARYTAPSVPGADPLDDWGRVLVEDLKGATHSGTTGTPNMDLLHAIADSPAGQTSRAAFTGSGPASLQNLMGTDAADWPLKVPGQQMIPDQIGGIQRLANAGFRKVINPTINFLSREPIYAAEYLDQIRPLRPLVEAGWLTQEDAVRMAQERATVNMVPFIHNTLERTQFAQSARNVMPFYFAQEQAFKRAGRLLAENPGAFRQYQLAVTGLANLGQMTKNANGSSYFNYPGSGLLVPGAAAALSAIGLPVTGSIPTSFSGRLQSLNTVAPFLDPQLKMGPMVAIPAHAIETLFPESRPAVDAVVGSQTTAGTLWNQLLPNTPLRNLIQAVGPLQDHSTAFNSAMLSTIQGLAYRNEIPPPDASPHEMQTFIDRVKNQTRITFVVKSILSAITPAAPTADIGDVRLRKEFSDDLNAHGFAQGLQTFLAAHPDATPYTVAQSESPSGASVPADMPAEDFINAHQALFAKYPNAAAWLIPQPNTAEPFSSAVYNEQVAQGLRVRKSPQQMVDDLYIAAGNARYYNVDRPAYQQALDQAANDPTAKSAIHTAWSSYLKNVGLQNPVWYEDLTGSKRTVQRMQAIADLRTLFANGEAPDTQQSADVGQLLGDWEAYQQALTVGRQDGYALGSRAATVNAWQNYLQNVLGKQKPALMPVINKVFMSA